MFLFLFQVRRSTNANRQWSLANGTLKPGESLSKLFDPFPSRSFRIIAPLHGLGQLVELGGHVALEYSVAEAPCENVFVLAGTASQVIVFCVLVFSSFSNGKWQAVCIPPG